MKEYWTEREDDDLWSVFAPTKDENGRNLSKAARSAGFGSNISQVIDETGKCVGTRITGLSHNHLTRILYELTHDPDIYTNHN